MTFPVRRGRITRVFGEPHGGSDDACVNATLGRERRHAGLDFVHWWPLQVRAVADGVVVRASNDRYRLGYHVIVEHRRNDTVYAHLRSIRVKVGDQLSAGDPIGRMGSTGLADRRKLHFEESTAPTYEVGKVRDPMLPWKRDADWDVSRRGRRQRRRYRAQYELLMSKFTWRG